MTTDDTTETAYAVGYGKPPKHAQWKKGQSGNPSGRPKRPDGVAALVAALLAQPVVVRRGRTTARMTRLEHLLHRLFEKAIAGDPRLMKLALDEAYRHEALAREAQAAPEPGLEPADAEVLAALYARLAAAARPSGEAAPGEEPR